MLHRPLVNLVSTLTLRLSGTLSYCEVACIEILLFRAYSAGLAGLQCCMWQVAETLPEEVLTKVRLSLPVGDGFAAMTQSIAG